MRAGAPCGATCARGELRLLIVAVTLAVAALTAVGFFADRLKGGCSAMRASCWAAMRWWPATTPTPAGLCGPGPRRWVCRPPPPWASHHGPRRRQPGRRQQAGGAQGGGAGLPAARPAQVAEPPDSPDRRTATFPRPARPGSMPNCSTPWACRWATRCCWVTPCASAASSCSSPTGVAGFMNFAPRVMINQADLAATGWCNPPAASPTGWPWPGTTAGAPSLCAVGRQRGQKAGVRGVRVESLEAAAPRCADAGAGREVSQPGGAAGGAAQCGGRGSGGPRLCRQATWTTAPCCGCWA
jgi:putative ABC transport system permease protein